MTALAIREMTPADAGPLANACAAIDPWKSLGFSPETLEAYLLRDDPALDRFVLGEQAGLMALRRPWLRGSFLEMLAVFPQSQGQGLGRAAIDWAKASDRSPNLWATVSAFNSSARQFYQAVGFVEVAPLPDLVATGLDEVLLRLRKA
jgi:GNAT superfamily N-acetyltransferase